MLTSLATALCTSLSAESAAMAWHDAFVAGDIEAIVALYEPDAILNPTLSALLVDDQTERADYFKALFATLSDRDVAFTETRYRSVAGAVVHSGHWTFTGVKGGERVEIPARVSFVYGGESCKIVDHHSSLMPSS